MRSKSTIVSPKNGDLMGALNLLNCQVELNTLSMNFRFKISNFTKSYQDLRDLGVNLDIRMHVAYSEIDPY